jgi:hypothetical protein
LCELKENRFAVSEWIRRARSGAGDGKIEIAAGIGLRGQIVGDPFSLIRDCGQSHLSFDRRSACVERVEDARPIGRAGIEYVRSDRRRGSLRSGAETNRAAAWIGVRGCRAERVL